MDFTVGSKVIVLDIYVGEILERNVDAKNLGEENIFKIGLKNGSVLYESAENVQLLETWYSKEKACMKSVEESNSF